MVEVVECDVVEGCVVVVVGVTTVVVGELEDPLVAT